MQPLPFFPSSPSCTQCDLHAQVLGEDGTVDIPHHVGIGSRHLVDSLPPSPTTDALVYIGRNPGYNEDQNGQCFIGRSGELLRETYIKGIQAHTRCSIYLTNAVRCYTVKNEPPKARHYKACVHHLFPDLRRITATHNRAKTILVLLGGEACKSLHQLLFNLKNISLRKAFSQQGTLYDLPGESEDEKLPVVVFTTYHPAYLLRDPNQIGAVDRHNYLLSAFLANALPIPSKPNIVPLRIPPP